jgi:hypothetical protein
VLNSLCDVAIVYYPTSSSQTDIEIYKRGVDDYLRRTTPNYLPPGYWPSPAYPTQPISAPDTLGQKVNMVTIDGYIILADYCDPSGYIHWTWMDSFAVRWEAVNK